MLDEHYTVINIGTGAGGGTLVRKLAESGKRIHLDRERYHSQDTWYDKKDKTFQPGSHYFVGGATKIYGAALFRFRERDFDIVDDEIGIDRGVTVSGPFGHCMILVEEPVK